jgi:DNA-binding response OmpR family regulator
VRVLLIERHSLLARPLKRGLEEEGFFVTVARDAAEGNYHQATASGYDVIILDPSWPEADGLPALQRRGRNNSRAPVLVLTSHCGPAAKVLALRLGADDYLPMPFELEELLGRLRSLARRGSNQDRSVGFTPG